MSIFNSSRVFEEIELSSSDHGNDESTNTPAQTVPLCDDNTVPKLTQKYIIFGVSVPRPQLISAVDMSDDSCGYDGDAVVDTSIYHLVDASVVQHHTLIRDFEFYYGNRISTCITTCKKAAPPPVPPRTTSKPYISVTVQSSTESAQDNYLDQQDRRSEVNSQSSHAHSNSSDSLDSTRANSLARESPALRTSSPLLLPLPESQSPPPPPMLPLRQAQSLQ
ncbi:hypothetical protein INR49_012517 [Caranx melampygus]|nr:hypothetical protein INR49_012517 [Caranx melampygus]